MSTISVIIGLIIPIVFAVVCWKLAGVRNRRQVLWAILGFFFPIVALIILLVIGKAGPKTA